MKIVLVRHTTSEWNVLGMVQGQTDIGLSQKGKNEARILATRLSGLGITLMVSSDLKRANQTAEIINSRLRVPLKLDSRLREYSYGNLEGLKNEEAARKCGIENWQDPSLRYDFRSFGGEDYSGVFARHLDCLKSLKREHAEETILVIGHGRGLWSLLDGLSYNPELKVGEYKIIDF